MKKNLHRQLQTRIKEHRNNIKLDQSKYSVISKHITEANHDWEKISILDFEKNYRKRNISEMIHIKEQKKIKFKLIMKGTSV